MSYWFRHYSFHYENKKREKISYELNIISSFFFNISFWARANIFKNNLLTILISTQHLNQNTRKLQPSPETLWARQTCRENWLASLTTPRVRSVQENYDMQRLLFFTSTQKEFFLFCISLCAEGKLKKQFECVIKLL